MSGTAACGAMPSHGGRYLTSTVAPPSSSCFLNFSESAFETLSLTVEGRAFHEVLRFLEAETGDLADRL